MEKLVRPVFTLDLNYKIIPGLTVIGKYDGTHPCITAATTADKVLIHSPHRKNAISRGRIIYSESNKEISLLHINQTVTALATGTFLPNDEKDILAIGTATHVLVYHVHDNKDILYLECPDGVKTLALGTTGEQPKQLLFVGGNSSVHAYDSDGSEMFWTTIGDVVTSIVLMDFNKDGLNEVIVSAEDFNIRVFKNNTITNEFLETEAVSNLLVLPENRFAYSVSNGTIGVYEQEVRIWRVKSKHFAVAMQCYDLFGQGTPQLITGWSNGKIDCRSIKNGEVLFKDSMSGPVAGLVEGDYRSIGKSDIICVSKDGEVKGFTTTKTLTTGSSGSEQDTIRELLGKKQALLMELKQYENNLKYNSTSAEHTESFESQGVIPANTRLQIGIATNEDQKNKSHVEIYITTNNSTIIKAVIIFAEGIFKGESHVVHPPENKLSSEVTIPLVIPKDNPADIHIKALVGYPNSIQFHVFEIIRQLPRFSMYSQLESITEKLPEHYVTFKINERLSRICMWLNQNFLLPNDIQHDGSDNLNLYLKSLRDGSTIHLAFEQSGKVTFWTSNIGLASDLVQSLAVFLNLDSLESVAKFVEEENRLKELMEKLTEIQDTRLRLGTDVADRLGLVRALIIRAEDSRINDFNEMSSCYNELSNLNQDLISGYNIRLTNYNDGLETMKEINLIIQKASRLRCGQKTSNMINYCRSSIINNNIDGLIRIIRTGQL